MLTRTGGGFEVQLRGRAVLRHSKDVPFLYIGRGNDEILAHRGHYKINEQQYKKMALPCAVIEDDDKGHIVSFSASEGEKALVCMRFKYTENGMTADFIPMGGDFNRFWINLPSSPGQNIYGCGEQFSYLQLKGRRFPLWVSESGVGRNKRNFVTFIADYMFGMGGDYYTTYAPQPTFMADGKLIVHLECSAYMEFDFSAPHVTGLYARTLPNCLRIEVRDSYEELSTVTTEWFGTQPKLPDWMYNGVILGIQGGTETMLKKLKYAEDAGVPVAAVWCQDWQGKRITKDGKRLFWNWEWNKEEYPGLDEVIISLKARGVRFLGYINPHLNQEGALFRECEDNNFFVKNTEGKTYIIDFGGFHCGTVDLTNPDAFKWYKDVIKHNMIGFGLSGWMADFGEYLPADAVLAGGEDARLAHNKWPVLWAQLNREAVDESGRADELMFFMRSAFTGSQRYCPLMWAGDQCVDFSRHDGLISSVCAALSAGLTGNGLHHSDIGGFTAFPVLMTRSRELFWRWAEMSAFSPVMRTHEGILPEQCHQYYDDRATAEFLARMAKVHQKLAPYIMHLAEQNASSGVPVQRPLFYHYNDPALAGIQDEYLLGPDLLVAPVWKKGAKKRRVALPNDRWEHLFTGEVYTGGMVTVKAPLGMPPVFFRKTSAYAGLFAGLRGF